MRNLEKNVWFEDVKTVYWTTIQSDEPWTLFLTKEDAIEFTNKFKEEAAEYLTEEDMAEYGIDGDAEEYIEEIELNQKEERAATNECGTVILERLNPYSGRWEEWVD